MKSGRHHGRMQFLYDGFQAISRDINQLVPRQQILNPGPYFGQKFMKSLPPQISEPQRHDPRRGPGKQDAMGKICILGDDDKSMFFGPIP